MIRPATCLSLVAALGAGLYLYQEKHRAQLLDREIIRTVKQADQGRDRIGLLRAEWALLTEPARLADLASHHLQLQPMQLSQFAKVEDLPNRLPMPATASTATAMDEAPDTLAALPVPVVNAAPSAAQPSPAPRAAAVQVAAAHPGAKPAAPKMLAAFKPVEHAAPGPVLRTSYALAAPVYEPALHASAMQPASVQVASMQPAPFVGSALGMAHTPLPAPVPVAANTGHAAGR